MLKKIFTLAIICVAQSTISVSPDLGNTPESMGSTSATLNQIKEDTEEGDAATQVKKLKQEIQKLDNPEVKPQNQREKSTGRLKP